MKNWKRHEEARRLRDSGMTLKAVGEEIGLSDSRVWTMLVQLEIRDRLGEPPPKWHEGLKQRTINHLERAGINSREDCLPLTSENLTVWRKSIALHGWEEDRLDWRWSRKKLPLDVVNDVRAWLGFPPYIPKPRIASQIEINHARRLLERHGWRVERPNNK